MKTRDDDREHDVEHRVANVGKQTEANSFDHRDDWEPDGDEVVAGEEEKRGLGGRKERKNFLIGNSLKF